MFDSAHDVFQTLVRATVDRKHPWRVTGFCTAGADGPAARHVILRKGFPSERRLVFFTDRRSAKVVDIARCARVELLFWNPQHSVQLRARGLAALETRTAETAAWWATVPEHARRDYGSAAAPGTPVRREDPAGGGDEIDLTTAREHFAVIEVRVDALEVLTLDRERHQRSRFRWQEADCEWTSETLVP